MCVCVCVLGEGGGVGGGGGLLGEGSSLSSCALKVTYVFQDLCSVIMCTLFFSLLSVFESCASSCHT